MPEKEADLCLSSFAAEGIVRFNGYAFVKPHSSSVDEW